VRELISPGSAPRFAGATATRAVIPAAAAGLLADARVGLWLTPGVHVVHYPVRGGTEVAVVVIAAEGRPPARAEEAWDVALAAPVLLCRVRGFDPRLREVLAGVGDWRTWLLYRTSRLPAWSRGPVTLIGDAAHPMLPYLAQGGALALEDALVLADCLAVPAGTDAAAFRNFEALRRARVERVQRASARQGRVYHLPRPLSFGRDILLGSLPGARLMARFDWLYGWPDATPC
jgi:salicylate hydroxylase